MDIFVFLTWFLNFVVGFVRIDLITSFLGVVVGVTAFAFLRKWIGW